MAKFGILELRARLKELQVAPPANVVLYGMTSPNVTSRFGNVTVQRDMAKSVRDQVEQLLQRGLVPWFMHLDDRRRTATQGLTEEAHDPNVVHLYCHDGVPGSLNVTGHPQGIKIPLKELTTDELRLHTSLTAPQQSQGDDDAADDPTREPSAGRDYVLGLVARRRGQPQFRANLMRAYQGRCAVTGTECGPALEAAHVRPYRAVTSHATRNGLLLRADIHTLFDLHLLSLNPTKDSIWLAPPLRKRNCSYATLHGSAIAVIPERAEDRPDGVALKEHLRHARIRAAVAARIPTNAHRQ